MNRLEMIDAVTDALTEANTADGLFIDWSPEATVAVDTMLTLMGDDSAEFHVRRDAPDTSKAIVDKIREGTLQDDVLDLFRRSAYVFGGGATDDDIEVALKRSHQSVSAARNTLVRKGYLVDTGQRRPNRYGNMAVRWKWTGKEAKR